MKKKLLTIGGVILISLLIVGVVYAAAFTMGNIDGVWGRIDEEGEAVCDRWAGGPISGSTDYDNPTHTRNDWWDQTYRELYFSADYDNNTDWNQVRYGASSNYGGCLSFANQSGFAFDGANGPTSANMDEAFVLGKFCHINNEVYSAGNGMDQVPLTVTVSGLTCDNGTTPSPAVMNFDYVFGLHETSNTAGTCEYSGNSICPDAVYISQLPDGQKFTCTYTGGVTQAFTISIKGFMMQEEDGSCPEWDADEALATYITEENTDNCSCLYAVVTDEVITAVDLISFSAEGTEAGITLAWQTANEVDNLGFNIYRAESADGTRVKLNETLIPTMLMPGSLEGSAYTFEDLTVEEGIFYQYWLEDVDANGVTTLHGPVVGKK